MVRHQPDPLASRLKKARALYMMENPRRLRVKSIASVQAFALPPVGTGETLERQPAVMPVTADLSD
jgi:hypothetical protein